MAPGILAEFQALSKHVPSLGHRGAQDGLHLPVDLPSARLPAWALLSGRGW